MKKSSLHSLLALVMTLGLVLLFVDVRLCAIYAEHGWPSDVVPSPDGQGILIVYAPWAAGEWLLLAVLASAHAFVIWAARRILRELREGPAGWPPTIRPRDDKPDPGQG